MSHFNIDDLKIGDEIWWFQVTELLGCSSAILVDTIELVHDQIIEINENTVKLKNSYSSSFSKKRIWGKTKNEAFKRLKNSLDKKWFDLDE